MDRFLVSGPNRLAGSVTAAGAKNAALPALAATLLTDQPVRLERVPAVRDIVSMRMLLASLGVESTADTNTVVTDPDPRADAFAAPYELVKKMRASVLVLGPLLARRGQARVSLPGGCAIGVRPIDQHLAALEALGATITLEHGYVHASAPVLRGARFRFAMPTVTGTENTLMAAVLAKGPSRFENCACEPEIVDLVALLRAMGARIEGEGGPTIEVDGVEELHGANHTIVGDRIEAGTYLIAAALTGGDVTVEGIEPSALGSLLEVLSDVGSHVSTGDRQVRVARSGNLRSADITTAPHPGFPTDLQAQFVALMTQAEGVATVRETVFENRFQHVAELARMGARITIDGHIARISGPARLTGANVMATDLRASACLVLAALVAEGDSLVRRIYHLDRGYERMEANLVALGARVERVAGPPIPE